jgi:hypothetical protein
LEAFEEPLDELSETLGEEHDLVDLARVIDAGASPPFSSSDQEAVLVAIERRRRGLQLAALRAGKTSYRERPGRVKAELTAYWEEA